MAPRTPYVDAVTGARLAPVKTSQIYWGAVPFVFIQVIMFGLCLAFPKMVTHYKNAEPVPSQQRIVLPPLGGEGLSLPGGGLQLPSGPPGSPPAPDFDLSQPPVIK